jgi:hypothetical protein
MRLDEYEYFGKVTFSANSARLFINQAFPTPP